jgi:5-methylthioadenosine/S-adenosylhomocysteine deaminase
MTQVDTLIDASWIVPVEPARTALADYSVVIKQGVIIAVLPTADAHARFSANRHVQLADHALIPGLINLHTHAAMSLMRGLADDLPLMDWLNHHIWPTETQHVSAEFVFDGSLLACAEMLRGGVTCCNDMYFYPEAVAAAMLTAGMRATLGIIVFEFPTRYGSDAEDYLHKGLVTRDEFKSEPLLSFSIAPHAPYTVSDKTFSRVLTLAEQLECPIHVHLHETDDEIRHSLKEHGLRPLARLQNLGLLGPNLIAVHAVHLTDSEIATLARYNCCVAHCPVSNLKLASGFSPIAKLLEAGVTVGIGTDGAASNNQLNVLGEMRLAALLAKGVSGRADTLPAYQALAMATLHAAQALGLANKIGSLVPGKAADITAIDLSSIEAAPCFDIISHLVYAAERRQVSHVWVDGQLLLDQGNLTRIDSAAIRSKAVYWRSKISSETSSIGL